MWTRKKEGNVKSYGHNRKKSRTTVMQQWVGANNMKRECLFPVLLTAYRRSVDKSKTG